MTDEEMRDPENWLEPGRESFSLHELSRSFWCSVQHFWNLIQEGELIIPKENIERVTSRAMIQVPRSNLVAFLRWRSSPEFRKQLPLAATKRRKGRALRKRQTNQRRKKPKR